MKHINKIGLVTTFIYVVIIVIFLHEYDASSSTNLAAKHIEYAESLTSVVGGLVTPITLLWLIIGYLMQGYELRKLIEINSAQHSALAASAKSDTQDYLITLHDRTMPKIYQELIQILRFLWTNKIIEIIEEDKYLSYSQGNAKIICDKYFYDDSIMNAIYRMASGPGSTFIVNTIINIISAVDTVENALSLEGVNIYRHIKSSEFENYMEICITFRRIIDDLELRGLLDS